LANKVIIDDYCAESERQLMSIPDPVNPEIIMNDSADVQTDADYLFDTSIEKESATIDFSAYFEAISLYLVDDNDRVEFTVPDDTCGTLNWKILNDQDEEMVNDFDWTDGSSLTQSQLKFTPTYETFGILTEAQDMTYYLSIQYGEDPGIATRIIPFTVKV
jgi:hypothetical protein